MNNTIATNAMTVPSTMIVMTTPMIAYTGPGPLSILESLLREDTGPIFIALVSPINIEVCRGIEVTPLISSNETTGDLELRLCSTSNEASVDTEVILLGASDEVAVTVIGIEEELVPPSLTF